jgi:hypothetical protein
VARGDDATTTRQGKQEDNATRGDTTTRRCIERQLHVKRLQHDEKSRKNQPGKWEVHIER